MTLEARTEVTNNDPYPSRIDGAPRLLPRKDPVVYGRWRPDAPLTPAEVAQYEREGFLVLESLFDDDEVGFLVDAARRLHGRRGGLEKDSIIAEPHAREIRSIFRIHEQSPVFRRLAADARLVRIARLLLNDTVYIHQSRVNYKPGFRGKEFYWHSDFETWHSEDGMPRMRALSMSILLTENTSINGPLMLIRGSHRHFVSCVGETPEEHFKDSLRKQEYGVPDDDNLRRLADEGGIAAPTGPAGSVVVFDCNTMHGSNGNITPFSRSNVFLVYNALANALEAPFHAATPRPECIATRRSTRPIVPVHGRLDEPDLREDA